MTRFRFLIALLIMSFTLPNCTGNPPTAPGLRLSKTEPTACNMEVQMDFLKTDYAQMGYTFYKMPEIVNELRMEKVDKRADGQLVGKTTHYFMYSFEDKSCKRTNYMTVVEKGDEKLVEDYEHNISRYFKEGYLIHERTKLNDVWWMTTYPEIKNVPVEIPNWATMDGTDKYMTWIFTGTKMAVLNGDAKEEEQCIHIPVWSQEGVWMKLDDNLTLMAGRVTFRNPDNLLTEDEIHNVIRFNAEGVVDPRGILYPVSDETYGRYQAYLLGKAESWERDAIKDKAAQLELINGTMNAWNKAKYKSVQKILEHRGAEATTKTTLEPEFEPVFFMTTQRD